VEWGVCMILDGGAGGVEVDGEAFGVEAVEPIVGVAVACQFVAGVGDAPDHAGPAPREPAEDEEGGRGAVVGQRLQQPVDVAFDPAGQVMPVGRSDDAAGRFDLEGFLDVEAEQCGRGVVGSGGHDLTFREA